MYGRVFKAILVILKFTQVKSYSSRSKELSLRPQAGWGPHPFCLLRPLGHIFGSHTYHVVVFCLLVSLDLPAQTVNTWMWGQGALTIVPWDLILHVTGHQYPARKVREAEAGLGHLSISAPCLKG